MYAFVRACLLMPCGHLLGKGWSLGSHLWCLIVKLSLSHWYPWSGVVLGCIDSWSLHSFLFCIFFSLTIISLIISIKMRYLVVSKKNNTLVVLGWDRKISSSWSPFVITQQASWCQSVILLTDFFIPPYILVSLLGIVIRFVVVALLVNLTCILVFCPGFVMRCFVKKKELTDVILIEPSLFVCVVTHVLVSLV